ncbi:MAG: DNA replication and repair protein RecF [Fibromonadales bacterium]|nr:DNA replication and repair protein RecF [Fibromonadales bacterium]
MLHTLEQINFRNLKEFSLDFSGGITIICGPNGHGKSNLLEAIHIICQGFSFKTKALQEAINWNAKDFILRTKTAAIQVDSTGVKGKLEGKEFRRANTLFGSAPLVFISPEDIQLAKGTPENKRNFLDELLCFCKKSNLDLLRRYRRVLQQRNRLLKDIADTGTTNEYLFEALTEQLSTLAVMVWQERKAICEILEPHINNFYQTLCNKSEEIKFTYARALTKEDFLNVLKEKFNAERASGTTLAGPHRDDIELLISGHSMRDFGSQGQCRSIALSMKFAAAEIIENHTGTKPILLLDDVFAELDTSRREAVAKIVKQKDLQTFAATPSAADLPFQGDALIPSSVFH